MRFLPRGNRAAGDARPTILHSVLSLACVTVNGIIGVILLFNFRNAVMTTIDRSSIRVFAINFIDISLSIGLCIIWLASVFVFQHLYEKDFMRSMVPKRFLIHTGIQLVLTGAVYLYSHFIL